MGTVRYNVLNGRVLSETRNGVQRDYQTDATGNTLALWDNTQTKTDTFDYFAYGKVANRTGTTATPFQFGGGLGYYQNDSNRTHVRARNFYVNLGKWSSQDPIGFNGRDYNLYRYARNNPVRWSDPSGLVVDSYKKVTDIDGFLSKGENARFLYTCRCGWIDKSHVATAFKAAARMYQY
ncbi:MAG: RHS repeat-associated core domain-containing protein [Armatimonadetes bacterium]|nr:RHS repeat-associated core domain-containing protein [Armatimonadota bacterium]